MPKEIYLVKVGMTMTEGMVSEWYIPDGASVNKGEMLYALETEKVNLDVDAEATGTVKQLVEVGVLMEPGDVVGYIFEPGEDISSDGLPGARPEAAIVTPDQAAMTTRESMSAPVVVAGVVNHKIKSSPAARRLARELGIDFEKIQGSGPGGRITAEDVQSARPVAIAAVKASPLVKKMARERAIDLGTINGSGPGGRIVETDLESIDTSPALALVPAPGAPVESAAAGESVPVKGMRRTIAQRMLSSLQTSAQLTMDMEVIMDDSVKLREQLIAEWQAQEIRPTYTDLVVKSVAKALKAHPRMNSIFTDEEITLPGEYNIGIAVALDEGLVVPVIRNADTLSLKEISLESARLADLARQGKLGLDDYAGGTFTVSSLGMYGVDSFTPILNQPQTGILGVNRLFEGLEWDGDRPVKTRKMNLSLTWDHRALDGAPAAAFLSEVKQLLSSPYRLLI
jgi:pyruvate dehydrogenase E2 component (dihydrolipoamide acetyltransferase)